MIQIQLEPMISINDLAKELGVNKFSIYHNIRKEKFPAGVKVGRSRLFRKRDIEEYFNSLNIENKIEL